MTGVLHESVLLTLLSFEHECRIVTVTVAHEIMLVSQLLEDAATDNTT